MFTFFSSSLDTVAVTTMIWVSSAGRGGGKPVRTLNDNRTRLSTCPWNQSVEKTLKTMKHNTCSFIEVWDISVFSLRNFTTWFIRLPLHPLAHLWGPGWMTHQTWCPLHQWQGESDQQVLFYLCAHKQGNMITPAKVITNPFVGISVKCWGSPQQCQLDCAMIPE